MPGHVRVNGVAHQESPVEWIVRSNSAQLLIRVADRDSRFLRDFPGDIAVLDEFVRGSARSIDDVVWCREHYFSTDAATFLNDGFQVGFPESLCSPEL